MLKYKEFSIIIFIYKYYNLIYKEMLNKNKLYIIEALLLLLYYKDFIYHKKISEEENKNGKIIARKFI